MTTPAGLAVNTPIGTPFIYVYYTYLRVEANAVMVNNIPGLLFTSVSDKVNEPVDNSSISAKRILKLSYP